MVEVLRSLVWAWRRRHAKQRVALQRRILGGERMVGIDVGAAEGMQPHWWAYEGAVDMYLFEPHEESAQKLLRLYERSPYRSMFHVIRTALAGATGERTFYMLNVPTGSSLYPIDPASEFAGEGNRYIYPIRETQVRVQRTAEALDQNNISRVDLAKVDVQGAELEILKGLDEARLAQLMLVEAEVNIVGGITRGRSPYIGAPTWAELDAFLVERGMRLLDVSITRQHRARDGDSDWYQREVFNVYTNSPGVSAMSWEADVVYVRDYNELIKRGDAAGVRRLVVALGGYRFFSEAYYIVEEAQKRGLLTGPESEEIHAAIRDWHRLTARRWSHSRNALWRIARSILARLGFSQLRRWKQYMWFEYPSG